MIAINKKDEANAQEWFINNLEVNSENKKMVLEKIDNIFKENNIYLSEQDLANNINDLLTGKDLIIKDLRIDSFKKISIDSGWIFYLLGECANESIGMQINGINITELKKTLTGEYTASGIPTKQYTGGTNVSFKSDSIASKVLTREERIGLKHNISNRRL